MKSQHFIDANGNYFVAIDPIEVPRNASVVPPRPAAHWLWVGGKWIEGDAPAAATPQTMSFAQLLMGLVAEAWITEAEGDAWLEGKLPAPVLALIATLPQRQRFAAKAKAARPSYIDRGDPLVAMMGAAQGKTAADLDAFFIKYAEV